MTDSSEVLSVAATLDNEVNEDSMAESGARVQYSRRHDATIDDYQADFARIWLRDLNERSAFDLWMHVVDHVSRVTRAVRLDNPAGVVDDLADTAVWLMSFIALCQSSANPLDQHFHINKATSDLIWEKFPAQCAICFDHELTEAVRKAGHRVEDEGLVEQGDVQVWIDSKVDSFVGVTTCSCLSRVPPSGARRDVDTSARHQLDTIRVEYAARLQRAGHKPLSIVDLEAMFDQIFKSQQRVLPLEKIAFHLQEEVGDATQAMKDCYTFDAYRERFTPELAQRRLRRLGEELADVFSWMFGMLLKVRMLYRDSAREYASLLQRRSFSGGRSNETFRFSDVLWSKYGAAGDGGYWETLKCPGCKHSPCECQRQLLIRWVNPEQSEADGRVADSEQVPHETRSGQTDESSNAVVDFRPTIVVTATSRSEVTANVDIHAVTDLYELGAREESSREMIQSITRLMREVQQSRLDNDAILDAVVELLQRVPADRRTSYVVRLKRLLGGLGVSFAGSATIVPLEPAIKDLLQQIGIG